MTDAFILPDGTITTDAGSAADEWAKAFYKTKDALARIRTVPEQILRGVPIKDLDETLLECDKALDIGE